MNLHFIHTNDVHSHLNEYLVIATQIRTLRSLLQQSGDSVFLFDIGDHADRMRPETDGTMGLVNAALIKQMHYDGLVFGNNEGLIIPRKHWQQLCEETGTPVLGSNLRDKETGSSLPFFVDSLLLERGGVRVGVFGVTAPYNEYYQIEKIQAIDPLEIIPAKVKELRERGADIVVLLSHLGLYIDRELPRQIEGIDLILDSHTHNLLQVPERIQNTWIAQAGKFASHFGHVTIDFDLTARRIRGVTGRVVAREDGLQPDHDLEQLLQEWGRRADVILDRVIADVPAGLEHHIHTESELANLLIDEMLEQSGAELGFINTGVILYGLDAGALTRRTLLACCPSPINPAVVKLYGWQIREVLKQALQPEQTHRKGVGFGFRGNEIGTLAIAGMRVDLDTENQIRQILIADSPLQDDRQYTAVTADYLLFSGVYEQAARGEKVGLAPQFLRQIIERAVIDPYKIRRAKVRRWLIET